MMAVKAAAMALTVTGVLALVYGTFSRAGDTAQAGLVLRDQHTVNVPMWIGAFVLLAGGLLLALPRYPRGGHLFWREQP
jgi:hypothetical protein